MNKALEAAIAAYQEQRWPDAIQLATQALQDEPHNVDALEVFGLAWFRNGYIDNAIEALEYCRQQAPDNLSYVRNLAELYRAAGRLEKSVEALSVATRLDPDSVAVLESNGLAMLDQGELAAAETALSRVAELKADNALSHFNLGEARRLNARFEDAIACYEEALRLKPDLVQAVHQKALCLLALGDYAHGWDAYEHRLDPKAGRQAELIEPRWLGAFDTGQRVFIYGEQGLGDVVLFSRYLPHLAAQGVDLLVALPAELLGLFRASMPNIDFIAVGASRPKCDWQIAIGSLPALYQTRAGHVPNVVPYLSAKPEKIAAWQARLSGDTKILKIGVCWAGNQQAAGVHHRSCTAAQMAMLFADLPNIKVFSLQFNDVDGVQVFCDKTGATDLTPFLHDFEDTAALVANLDLVVSVDTALLNLAGALNIPAWGLLPLATEWRWLGPDRRSRWYPSVVRFAQTKPSDWTVPLSLMRDTLYSHIKAGVKPGVENR
jgi:cytochrome c-type biogenesis protein CcmH/NrfG